MNFLQYFLSIRIDKIFLRLVFASSLLLVLWQVKLLTDLLIKNHYISLFKVENVDLDDKTIIVGFMMCGNENTIEEAVVMVKTIALFTNTNVNFHIIRDNDSIEFNFLRQVQFIFYYLINQKSNEFFINL